MLCRRPGTMAVMRSSAIARASDTSYKTVSSFRRNNTGMGLIIIFNLNGVIMLLAMERKADTCGKGGGSKHMWYTFHKATTHSDEEHRIRLCTKANNRRANCVIFSCTRAVHSARDPPLRCDPNHLCSSRWKRRQRRNTSDYLIPHTNQVDHPLASPAKRLATRPS